MANRIQPATVAALARVMAGESMTEVSRATGIAISTLWRTLKAQGLKAPKDGRRKPVPPTALAPSPE